MSARLALALAAVSSALSIGCSESSVSSRAEVSVTDLVIKTEPDGTIHAGSFNLHVALPASASGASGIRLHTLELRAAGDLAGPPVARLRSTPPGDLDPGASIVSPIEFELRDELTVNDPIFDFCILPAGFYLSVTYFDEAEGAFFTVGSTPSWLSLKSITGITWGKTFGDADPQIEQDAAVFADGSSVIVGSNLDERGSSGEPLGATPFVLKLDAAGNTLWDRRMKLSPTSGSQVPLESQGPRFVAASPDGGVVVAGALDGTLDPGSGAITSAGDTDVFLARIDATGKTTETRRFGDAFAQTVLAMDTDAAGNVVLVGTLASAIDFGAGPIGPIIDPTVTSYYVARLPEAGAPIYAKVPLALAMPTRFHAAVGAEGTVVLGGTFTGNAWVGAEPPHMAMSPTGFLLQLAPDGSVAWSAVIDRAVVAKVALDHGDVVAVIGIGNGNKVLVGGKELPGGPMGSVMLARFDPAGALRDAIPLADAGAVDVTSLVVDSSGHSLLAGVLSAPLSLAGSTADPFGRPSTFFAELDQSGAHVRSMAFGCPSMPADIAVARSGSRDVLLTSAFSGSVDFGKGTIASAGETDLFVAKLPAK